MKIELNAKQLKAQLMRINRVKCKNTHPILNFALLHAEPGKCTIARTDADQYAIASVDVSAVDGSGEVMLDSVRLAKFLPKDGAVVIEINGDMVAMKTDRKTVDVSVKGHKVDDFPTCPSFDECYTSAVIAADDVADMITRVLPFIAGETRYVLRAVYIDAAEIVATDEHRLSILRRNGGTFLSGYDAEEILLPAAALKVFGRNPGELTVQQSTCRVTEIVDGEEVDTGKRSPGNMLRITAPEIGLMVYVRVVEGMFPPYKRVIPEGASKARGTIDAKEFRQAAKEIKGILPKDHPYVVFQARGDKASFTGAESADSISFDGVTFDAPVEAAYDPAYLAQIPYAGNVSVAFHGDCAPMVFDDDRVMHLLMPVDPGV